MAAAEPRKMHLTPQESYDLLEIAESRCEKGSVIFCTQYEPDDWYARISPDPNIDTPMQNLNVKH